MTSFIGRSAKLFTSRLICRNEFPSLGGQSLRHVSSGRMEVKGVLPPIVTNFLPDGKIDYSSMQKNIIKWEKFNLAGYVIFGSNGESCLIDVDERATHIGIISSIMSPQLKRCVIVGVTAESTISAIRQCEMFTHKGAHALLVATPTFYKANLTHKALIKFYTAVADKAPSPVIVYNVPANTGVDIAAETVIELANHPNIIGVKDSGGDVAKLARIVHETQHVEFSVLAGSAGFLFPGVAVGCSGGVCAIANVLVQECIDLFELTVNKDYEAARELQGRMVLPNALVTRKFGVPGLKAAMEMFGFKGGICREPLLPLEDNEKDLLRDAFTKNGFIPKI